MAGSKKKKVGGVKARARVSARAPTDIEHVAPPKKKVGGVKTIKHHYCLRGCEGEWRHGMWCHFNWCSELRLTWKAHGQTIKDWMCFYGCPSEEMPSGFTHHAECEFWEQHPSLTPFDTDKEEQRILQQSLWGE